MKLLAENNTPLVSDEQVNQIIEEHLNRSASIFMNEDYVDIFKHLTAFEVFSYVHDILLEDVMLKRDDINVIKQLSLKGFVDAPELKVKILKEIERITNNKVDLHDFVFKRLIKLQTSLNDFITARDFHASIENLNGIDELSREITVCCRTYNALEDIRKSCQNEANKMPVFKKIKAVYPVSETIEEIPAIVSNQNSGELVKHDSKVYPSRFYLNVDYRDRNSVKQLGARWDRDKKKWYIANDPKIIELFKDYID